MRKVENMAYSELIKNFNKIRDYMREFYVYGFKSRDEFTKKSARSYDDERRRMESWLGDYMRFRQTTEGKNVFLSIDSRVSRYNPLYKAWKTKSFTDGDITLHFILFDILSDPDKTLTLNQILNSIGEYLYEFGEMRGFDESSVRKKLKEYVEEGIITAEKQGKTVLYRRAKDIEPLDSDILDFFSEVTPCGVVGSYLLDKQSVSNELFAFKHHYITNALDSEILYSLFRAMNEKKYITLETINRRRDRVSENQVVPLRIMISVQNGRQHLMAYIPRFSRITSIRVDNIISVKLDDICPTFDSMREKLDGMTAHLWGVSTQSDDGNRLEHVEFTVKVKDHEQYIPERLRREKRCGTVEKLDSHTYRFSADVYDTGEMVPWIRTFICRISSYSFSNKRLEDQFKNDLDEMYRLYGVEGGESE